MMLLTFALHLSTVAASLFSDRTSHFINNLPSDIHTFRRTANPEKRDAQAPLLPQVYYDTTGTHYTAKLPVECASFLGLVPFYWTNIALGTPNQAFRMILDLGYGGVIVRSAACDDFWCGPGFKYYRNQSSTFQKEDERFLIHLPAQYIYGNTSRDHMQLVGLNLTNVTFGEVDDFHGENYILLTMKYFADGAIGLGPPNASVPLYTDTVLPNLMSKMVTQQLLKKNVMTLDLPPHEGDMGSLTVGAVPEGDMARIPFSNKTDNFLTDAWQVKLDNIAVTGNNSTNILLNDTVMIVELGYTTTFPPVVAEKVFESMGVYKTNFVLPEFNCTKWDTMPDLVFTFAGHDIVLTRDDYADRGFMGPNEVCFVWIEADDWLPPTLGVKFLGKFLVVFDMDENELGLINRTSEHRY